MGETPLIKLINDNKEEILKANTFTDAEFQTFTDSLVVAENQREEILKKIIDAGELDLEKIQGELEASVINEIHVLLKRADLIQASTGRFAK